MPAKSALTPDFPWPGPAPYSTADRAFFHGRKRETEELLRLIQRDVLTIVMGAAGVGKTSLIQAGLLPALAESEWMPVVPKLDWTATPPKSDAPDLDPGAAKSLDNPLSRKLIDALISASVERNFSSPEPQSGETLWEYFHRSGNRWWSSRQRVVTPIVIIDEFESVFTSATQNATAERQAASFLKELSQLVANRPPQRLATRLDNGNVTEAVYNFDPVPLRIVLVMRDDFASQLTRLRPLFPTLRRSELHVEPFTTSQARDVLLRGSLQASLMSDAALDAIVAHLSKNRPAASEILPAKLSALAHRLALARREHGGKQITPEFLAKEPTEQGTPTAESSISPVIENNNLRKELAASEKRRRGTQHLALVAALIALAAVAAPFAREQMTRTKAKRSAAAATAADHAEEPAHAPAPADSTVGTTPFESPFSISPPEFLPAAPVTQAQSPTPGTPEPISPKPPVEPATEEPLHGKHPAQPTEPVVLPSEPAPPSPSSAASPHPSSSNGGQSALSPDAQRQLNAASADRKEQQRREFLRRQQEGRKAKEGTTR
jgi:hypothetical protein